MLEYHKTILHKVSFSQSIFERELQKGLKSLKQDEERQELLTWAKQMFGHGHQEAFSKIIGQQKQVEITH